jgi:hypothetical protein
MSDRTTYRDEELGAALRQLEVPEHTLDFHARLHQRLAEERLAARAERRRRRNARRAAVRWAVRVAAVAAIVAAAVVVGFPRTNTGPEVATAAEIKAKVRAALAGADNLSGILVFDGPEKGDENRWRFALTAEGDFRLAGLTLEEEFAYDASRGVERSISTSASIEGDDTPFYAVRRGLAPGPPDPSPSSSILQRGYGAVVRAFLAVADPRVAEITYQGRPAWRLESPVSPNLVVLGFAPTADRIVVTVDQTSGIPVRILETFQGQFVREFRMEELAVDRDVPRETFTLEFPEGAEVMRSDEGYRRVPLADAEEIVGYAPLVPNAVPDGYELAEVAVATKTGLPTGVEGGNPASTRVVSLSYRRGLDQLIVTTRLRRVPGFPDRWDDPLATGEGFVDEPEPIRLSGGALAGIRGELLIVPRNVPHLWALTDELVVTVGGDLSRAELLQAAESLGTHP